MSEPSLIYIERTKILSLALSAAMTWLAAACSPVPKPEDDKVVLVTEALPPENPANVVIGTVRAVQLHDVPAQNGGRVERLLVDVGNAVQAGQVLAILEKRAETLNLAQARNDYRRLDAVAEERKRNLTRMANLIKASAVSQAEFDAAKADAVAAARAAAAAKDAVGLARRNLDLTVIRAPVDGIVATRPVKLSDQLAAGTVAFEIDGDGSREIVASIDQDTAQNLTAGIIVPYRAGGTYGPARLTHIGRRVAGTGACEVRLQILSGNPPPGATVEVLLAPPSERRASALVPVAAVTHRGKTAIVFVVGRDKRLRAEPVEVLSIDSGGTLVAGAVLPGETIAAAGAAFLRPGMAVNPTSTPR